MNNLQDKIKNAFSSGVSKLDEHIEKIKEAQKLNPQEKTIQDKIKDSFNDGKKKLDEHIEKMREIENERLHEKEQKRIRRKVTEELIKQEMEQDRARQKEKEERIQYEKEQEQKKELIRQRKREDRLRLLSERRRIKRIVFEKNIMLPVKIISLVSVLAWACWFTTDFVHNYDLWIAKYHKWSIEYENQAPARLEAKAAYEEKIRLHAISMEQSRAEREKRRNEQFAREQANKQEEERISAEKSNHNSGINNKIEKNQKLMYPQSVVDGYTYDDYSKKEINVDKIDKFCSDSESTQASYEKCMYNAGKAISNNRRSSN